LKIFTFLSISSDIRAQLEIDVQDVLNLVSQLNKLNDNHHSMRNHIKNKISTTTTVPETSEDESESEETETDREHEDGVSQKIYSKAQRQENKGILISFFF
jgi:hypothetical protein